MYREYRTTLVFTVLLQSCNSMLLWKCTKSQYIGKSFHFTVRPNSMFNTLRPSKLLDHRTKTLNSTKYIEYWSIHPQSAFLACIILLWLEIWPFDPKILCVHLCPIKHQCCKFAENPPYTFQYTNISVNNVWFAQTDRHTDRQTDIRRVSTQET